MYDYQLNSVVDILSTELFNFIEQGRIWQLRGLNGRIFPLNSVLRLVKNVIKRECMPPMLVSTAYSLSLSLCLCLSYTCFVSRSNCALNFSARVQQFN
jgi:hypothetical protein